MPTIAAQLRAARHRRARRRRVTVGVFVAVAAGLLGARLVADATTETASATSTDGAPTSAHLAPASVPTTSQPTTSQPTTSRPTPSPPNGLNPGLVAAFGRAQVAAAHAGHELTITSGFRTAKKQAAMLDAEIAKRGSRAEALRWVFPPDKSMHVQGLAIDVGDKRAAAWLVQAGARFGLCHTLAWEWWHFEWRPRWETAGACPAPAQTPSDAPGP